MSKKIVIITPEAEKHIRLTNLIRKAQSTKRMINQALAEGRKPSEIEGVKFADPSVLVAANELFAGTKPMQGPELDCLNEAFLKGARKEPTIKRKKQ